jgi:hypothetical protein
MPAAYSVSLDDPKITKTSVMNGQWSQDGTIAVRIKPGDMSISAELELPFRNATSPYEARRQVLERLQVIGSAFATHASTELARGNR